MEFVQNLLQSDLIWQLLIAFALLLLFRSVPQSTLDKLQKRAEETETPADDIAVKILDWLNTNKELIPELLVTKPVIESKPMTETVTTTTTVTPFTTEIAGTTVSFPTVDDDKAAG